MRIQDVFPFTFHLLYWALLLLFFSTESCNDVNIIYHKERCNFGEALFKYRSKRTYVQTCWYTHGHTKKPQ